MVLPKIECEAATLDYGRYAIGPMTRGYGVTVGVALRRVLLSSLPGAAITSVRITGVPHEFSTIAGAKEDMIRLLLNLKLVRLVSHAEEAVRMRIVARGKSIVTAGDIECPSDIEIINPELNLLTLDTLDSELQIELMAERGVGYSPAEERQGLPIGQIPVDAIFSPVAKVSYAIEPARIDQITNYDLLRFEIWTDGTLRPDQALRQAAQIMLDHLSPVAAFAQPDLGLAHEAIPVGEQHYDVDIEDLELPMRAYNCLKRAGVTSVGDILDRLAKGPSEMLAIRNFGQKSLDELVERMVEKGFLPQGYGSNG
ncbi:MAG: DNA-directed RNA polymerase subunit alpha [Chloroflexota bacterium]